MIKRLLLLIMIVFSAVINAEHPTYLVPLSLDNCGKITFKPGLRVQVRYLYDQENHNNDIFIKRFRLKIGGDAFDLAKYYTELKIDDTGRYCKDPKAAIENAWLDIPLCKDLAYLRIGLYDLPFSRNALTSDSKLLFMDRSQIKEALTDLGLADNTIGVLLHGRPYRGCLEYAIGIFDNDKFEKLGKSGTKHSDQLMPAARFVWNFWDPSIPPEGYADYYESYLCKGKRLAIGFNAAYLGSAHRDGDQFDLTGWGIDVFLNKNRFVFQAEYDWFNEKHHGYGWYAQAGYLFYRMLEAAVRYQELDSPNDDFSKIHWTTIGINAYFREHHLKIQTEYTYKEESDDVFQIQLQLDY